MFFFSSRRRHTRCALVTGVQTCALPIWTIPVSDPAAARQIPPHRHVAAAELGRDPPDTPPQILQPQHRRDLLRRPHRLPPQLVNPRGTFAQTSHLYDLLSIRGGPVPHVAPGPVFHVA